MGDWKRKYGGKEEVDEGRQGWLSGESVDDEGKEMDECRKTDEGKVERPLLPLPFT